MDDATLLRKGELFQAFGPDDLPPVLAAAGRRRLQRGDEVFAEGDAADRMYVVRAGRVAVTKRQPEGKESIVALMEAGDLFGEMGLFDGEPHAAGARALEPVELVVVPYEPVAGVLRQRPALLWPVLGMLSRRLRVADGALADSLFLDVTGRTAKRLLELAGGHDEFTLPVTQEELAGMVGASRERVNKALAQFIRLGWLAVHDRRYRIRKRDELVRRAR